mgnify:CR=1 FL=1
MRVQLLSAPIWSKILSSGLQTRKHLSSRSIKSISESASCIQTAISKLISTEINYLKEKATEEEKKLKDINLTDKEKYILSYKIDTLKEVN